MKKINEELEFISELVAECLREEKYEVTEYEKTNTRTTAYSGIFVKDRQGKEYTIVFDEKWKKRGEF